MKILLVEDNHSLAKAYARILKDEDHDVDVCVNPLTAISKALRINYDLMIVDVLLPEISGVELIKRLREEKIDTPIVVSSNLGSGVDEDELRQLGVKEILLKSAVGPAELRETVERYARK